MHWLLAYSLFACLPFLHSTEPARKESGVQWILFFQDTNGLVFKVKKIDSMWKDFNLIEFMLIDFMLTAFVLIDLMLIDLMLIHFITRKVQRRCKVPVKHASVNVWLSEQLHSSHLRETSFTCPFVSGGARCPGRECSAWLRRQLAGCPSQGQGGDRGHCKAQARERW